MISIGLQLFAAYVLRRLRHPVLLFFANCSKRIGRNDTQHAPMIVSKRSFLDKIPPNSWDSHMHVVDPINYPLVADAHYVPKTHLLSEALRFESTVGLRNIVFVQPSVYGNDNTCLLNALRQLGPHRGRAVVTFDPCTTSMSTLQEWHRIGVRGVRVNLQSVGKTMDSAELESTLQRYADIIRPLGWVLQIYVPLATSIVLEDIVPKLRVKVCLDHFGYPTLSSTSLCSRFDDPYLVPGFDSLIRLLRQGNTFVKMSAPYRISKDMGQALEPMAMELLRVAGNSRVLFATDWPHTRFEGLDIRPFVERVIEWCGNDDVLIDRIFRSNAEELWR